MTDWFPHFREGVPKPANDRAAQGTEARRAETENTGSVHDGPVAESDAPKPSRQSEGA
jgi:hypothetical protein